MAVLVESEISVLALEELQANTTTDPPVVSSPLAGSEMERAVNDAYSLIWEASGAGLKVATGVTLWTPAPTSTTSGVVTGLLTTVKQILHLWASTSGSSTGDPVGGDVELDHKDYSEVQWWRARSAGLGTYAAPKIYAVTRLATATDADVNKWQLDVYPGVSARYFPAHYAPQFTPLNGTTIVTPDVTDIQSRDIAYLVALHFAPLTGRAELAPAIEWKLSESTRLMLERKAAAMADAGQDK